MSRIFATLLTAAAVGSAGYYLGKSGLPHLPTAAPAVEAAAAEGASESEAFGGIIYYRHPDGVAEYSATPRNTGDGRPFKAVHASEDVSFDPDVPQAKPSQKSVSSGERKVLYYRNPMGLPDTSKVPKKDSMGMDYLPVYEGEAGDASTVKVTPGKLQRTGVRTALAREGTVSLKLQLPGVIALDERLVSVISMRADAFIETVADVTTGSRIHKGDALFEFYSKEIAAAGAQYLAESGASVKANPETGAAVRLRNLGVPASAVEDIASKGKVPPVLKYTSPRTGVVLERSAIPGMMAAPGATLFRIADISKVWAVADVAEADLGRVSVGDTATVKLKQRPGLEMRGSISAIYPEIQMQTRTAKVRIELSNPDGVLLPNMYVEAEIVTEGGTAAVAVPNSAVIDTGDRQLVFIEKGEGRYEPKDVKLGVRGDDFTEIKEGVQKGDRVVVTANFLLDAESNLNAALSAMEGSGVTP